MKKYFYSDGIKKDGPFTLEELKSHKINKDTLVWFDGLKDWLKASEVDEIVSALSILPPPLPLPPSLKYYDNYEEDEDVTFAGILLLAISMICYFASLYLESFSEFLVNNRPLVYALSLIIEIFSIIWVVKISKKQNRNTFGWGIFAFFLPSICLIVLGKQKKLRKRNS